MSQIENLLKYQQVDEKLLAIEKEVTNSQERKNYVNTKNFLTMVPEKLQALEGKAIQIEGQLKDLEAKYNALAETLEDFDNLDELVEEGAEISFYKKNVIQTINSLRGMKAEMVQLQKAAQAAAQEYQDLKKKTLSMQKVFNEDYNPTYKAYKAAKTEEMNKIKAELDVIAQDIDPLALRKYLEKRSERIFPVICPIMIRGNEPRCSKCGTGFPISSLEKLRTGSSVVECDYCHRILYTTQ